MEQILTSKKQKASKKEQWFDELVGLIRTHELELATNTAPNELKEFYTNAIQGNVDELLSFNKQLSQKHFVSKIIVDYIRILEKHRPLKLAFDYNDSSVLVWVEIQEDNFQMEKKLILAEAKINANYHKFGFAMSSTIVEDSDKLTIPNHYTIYKA
jgi:hypothetical protein